MHWHIHFGNRIVKSCKGEFTGGRAEQQQTGPFGIHKHQTHTDKTEKMFSFVLCNDFRLPFSPKRTGIIWHIHRRQYPFNGMQIEWLSNANSMMFYYYTIFSGRSNWSEFACNRTFLYISFNELAELLNTPFETRLVCFGNSNWIVFNIMRCHKVSVSNVKE